MGGRTFIVALTLGSALSLPLHAQAAQSAAATPSTTSPSTEPGSNLTVYLLTFGWGDVVWERFGHNAIWIRDRASGTDITYHWGMFDFKQQHFVWRFVTGDTRYWMEGIDLAAMLRYYKARNRSILSQELNFSPAQRLKLQQFVEWNALPENKFYRYDYFRDNCSTRLRDAIDRILDGQLKRATDSIRTTTTYRSHTARLTADNIPLYTGIMLALGHPADRALTAWEEMFLPTRVSALLRSVQIEAPGGARVPLVRSETTIFRATR